VLGLNAPTFPPSVLTLGFLSSGDGTPPRVDPTSMKKDVVEDLLGRLNLHEEEAEDFV
jgi:hypothetical protein